MGCCQDVRDEGLRGLWHVWKRALLDFMLKKNLTCFILFQVSETLNPNLDPWTLNYTTKKRAQNAPSTKTQGACLQE